MRDKLELDRREALKFVGAGVLAGTTGLTVTQRQAFAQGGISAFEVFNVQEFGAIGDGQSHPLSERYQTLEQAQKDFPAAMSLSDETDWAAIQSAIDALPSAIPGLQATNAGIVFFPPGIYRANKSIDIIDDGPHNFRHNIQLVGSNGGASGFVGCVIEWYGTPTDPIVRLHSRDCLLKNLAFRVGSGQSTIAAIEIDKATGSNAGASTNNAFEYLQIGRGQGEMVNGIYIAETAPGNVENMFFQKCFITHVDESCVHIPSVTGQSKHHSFYSCGFGFAEYGIKTIRGSFQTYSCSFTHLTVAVALGFNTDNIVIQDSDLENCQRLLTTEGGSNGCWPVSIIGGRYDVRGLHPDGAFIIFTYGGPLLVQNVAFGPPRYHPAFKIRAEIARPGTSFIAIGNCFPNESPYEVIRGAQRRISFGNVGVNAEQFPVHIDDEMLNFNGATGSITISPGQVS